MPKVIVSSVKGLDFIVENGRVKPGGVLDPEVESSLSNENFEGVKFTFEEDSGLIYICGEVKFSGSWLDLMESERMLSRARAYDRVKLIDYALAHSKEEVERLTNLFDDYNILEV